jgi:hypothetical protein
MNKKFKLFFNSVDPLCKTVGINYSYDGGTTFETIYKDAAQEIFIEIPSSKYILFNAEEVDGIRKLKTANYTFIDNNIQVTPTPTQTPSSLPIGPIGISSTPTQTPTRTPTPSITKTPSSTPTQTPTSSITPTQTRTPTRTPTRSPTPTQTVTPSITPTTTPTSTNYILSGSDNSSNY